MTYARNRYSIPCNHIALMFCQVKGKIKQSPNILVEVKYVIIEFSITVFILMQKNRHDFQIRNNYRVTLF